MSYLTIIARILFALMFIPASIMYIINKPIPLPPELADFGWAMGRIDYFFPLLHIVYFVGGLVILLGWYVPLALIVFAPILLHILLLHIFLDPKTILPGLVATILWLFLAWTYRSSFATLFQRKANLR